jgi:hypothetical protein
VGPATPSQSKPPAGAPRALGEAVGKRWRAWAGIGASSRLLKWLRTGVRVPWRRGPPPPFNMGASLKAEGLSPEQLAFLGPEVNRLMAVGGLQRARSRARHVSRAFLVPKPGGAGFRLVFDLRYLNQFVKDMPLSMETLKRLRLLANRGDFMVSFDVQDGFYHVRLAPEDRKYFQVQIAGQLYEFVGLPMGFKLSPAIFGHTMDVWTRWARAPAAVEAEAQKRRGASEHRLKPYVPQSSRERAIWAKLRRRGMRILPYVDDFLLLAATPEELRVAQQAVYHLLLQLGIRRHPTKGVQDPTTSLTHLGLEVDTDAGVFRVAEPKISRLRKAARDLLCDAARRHRQLPVRRLAGFVGLAQSVYLAVPAARFFLRALHDVIGSREGWNGSVTLSPQARRDLQWWAKFPEGREGRNNGRTIWTLADQAVLHCDSSTFGWGGVLNGRYPTRGLWTPAQAGLHITEKELRAVRLTVEAFLPHLRGRRVLLYEDNQAVVAVLSRLTSGSPRLMAELRKLWWLLDSNEVEIRPRYIRSAANVWADALSRETGMAEAEVAQHLFDNAQRRWPHSVDRFATWANRKLPRYNSVQWDPQAEAIDALSQPDEDWRAENNWVFPPESQLEATVAKLLRSGAAATVVAPQRWGALWHQRLLEMTSDVIWKGRKAESLFLPGGRSLCAWHGTARERLALYRVPLREPQPRGPA